MSFDNKRDAIILEAARNFFGIPDLVPEDIIVLARLAHAWKLQADIGGLNKTNYNALHHGTKVRATAIMPSMTLCAENPILGHFLRQQQRLAIAEEKIIHWAFEQKFVVKSEREITLPMPLLEMI